MKKLLETSDIDSESESELELLETSDFDLESENELELSWR